MSDTKNEMPEAAVEEADPEKDAPWQGLAERIESEDGAGVAGFLEELNAEDQRRAFSRLNAGDQAQAIELLGAVAAADVIENLPDGQAADILEDIAPPLAADIVEQLPADVSTDLLQEMHDADSAAILDELDNELEADRLRELSHYDSESAGGLMATAFVAFHDDERVRDVLGDFREHASDYADRDVQYTYVLGGTGELKGVLRLRDLVLTAPDKKVVDIMIPDPVCVETTTSLEALSKVFEGTRFLGLPVVDEAGVLVGVVSRAAVNEARAEHSTDDFLSAAGIVGGEELRSMPMHIRCVRRLSWLAPNIGLNIVAASIIALYQDTIQSVIALAVFLPIVSDMSGCSGNQAVAVSMRELTLGLIRPAEYMRVIWKEGILGFVNGCVLGVLLGTIAALWKDNIWLGLVIGGALALNTIVSVLLGGLVPLLMKKLKVDPALASGPILTTCTDMCGFFLVLNIAATMIDKIA